jgi:hypothetical protein
MALAAAQEAENAARTLEKEAEIAAKEAEALTLSSMCSIIEF